VHLQRKKEKTCVVEVSFLTESGDVWAGCCFSTRAMGSPATAAAGGWLLAVSDQLNLFRSPIFMSWWSEEIFLVVYINE